MYKAFVHPEIQLFLDSQKKADVEQLFIFPWGTATTAIGLKFWLSLLGRDDGKAGWLGDEVCTYNLLDISIFYKELGVGVSLLTDVLFFQILNDSILDYGLNYRCILDLQTLIGSSLAHFLPP